MVKEIQGLRKKGYKDNYGRNYYRANKGEMITFPAGEQLVTEDHLWLVRMPYEHRDILAVTNNHIADALETGYQYKRKEGENACRTYAEDSRV